MQRYVVATSTGHARPVAALPSVAVCGSNPMGHYVTTLPEHQRLKVAQEFKAFMHKGKGKGYQARPEFGDCSKPCYTVLVGASKAPCQSEPTQAPQDTRPVLRPKDKTKTVTDTRPLFDAGCAPRQTVLPVAVWRDTRPVESAMRLALFANTESRQFLPVFDTKADLVRFQNQNKRHACLAFWQDLPLVKLDALLASIGKAACARARGYLHNEVSDTSLAECVLGARYAVLAKVFAHKGEFALEALAQLDQPTVISCARAIGIKHGVKAATDSEFRLLKRICG